MQFEEMNNRKSPDLIDLNSPNNYFNTSGAKQRSDSADSNVESTPREYNGFSKSTLGSGQNHNKVQKFNSSRSFSNHSNLSLDTAQIRDKLKDPSNVMPAANQEAQKLILFADENEKYSDESSASPANNKRDTDGESTELSFEYPSMERFRMMEDHSFIQSSIIDQDLERVESLVEGWTSDLKKKILAEFSQSKIRLLEYYRQQIALVKEKHDKEINRLKKENDSYRELARTFEKSLSKKDETISNLGSKIRSSENKMKLQKYFSEWKIKLNESDKEKFMSNMAVRHYREGLIRKVVRSWHSAVANDFRNEAEKSSRLENRDLIMQMKKDYEEKLMKMNESLEQSKREIERLNQSMESSDIQKNAIMRSMCALNLDAMSAYQERSVEAEKLSRSDGAREVYPSFKNNSFSHHTPTASTHDEPTYFSDPNPPVEKTVAPCKKPASHYPIKIRQPSKPKQLRVISAKRTTYCNVTGNLLAPPMASVVVERHHPITKETVGHAIASKFPADRMRPNTTNSFKASNGTANQLIRVLN